MFYCGLYVLLPSRAYDRESLPLTSLEVEAVVLEQACEVRLSHTFCHSRPAQVEAEFAFPLIENAAVCGFEAQVGDRRVVGRAKEKQEARADYARAVSRGDGAYLLEQQRTDVFTAALGNVPPHTPVVVRTTYVCELGSEGEALRFVLPTSIMPRYDTSASGTSSCYMRFQATYLMGSKLLSLQSPSHAHFGISVEGKTATVRGEESRLDRDLVLLSSCEDAHAPRVLCEALGGPSGEAKSFALQLSLFPRVTLREQRCELLFLVDRSGSMSSDGKMDDVRAALSLFVRSIPTGSLFDIISFGSRHSSLFPVSAPYTRESQQTALDHISAMTANYGGTDLLPPLQSILSRPVPASFSRQLFVLTDGGVSNLDLTLSFLSQSLSSSPSQLGQLGQLGQHGSCTRVYSLGVGNSVSHALVEGLARIGGGTAEYVARGESSSAKVLRQLGAALQPRLEDVRVRWGGKTLGNGEVPGEKDRKASAVGGMLGSLLGYVAEDAGMPARREAVQAPRSVPALMSMRPFVVYAVYDGAGNEEVPKEVTVEGKVGDGVLCVTLPVQATAAPGRLLHTLAARKMIRDAEEARDRDAVVRLGVEYGLTSSATSFIAVEERAAHEKYCYAREAFRNAEPVSTSATLASSLGCLRWADGAQRGGGMMRMQQQCQQPMMMFAKSASVSNSREKRAMCAASPPPPPGAGYAGYATGAPLAPARSAFCGPPSSSSSFSMCDSAECKKESSRSRKMSGDRLNRAKDECAPSKIMSERFEGKGGASVSSSSFDALVSCQQFDGSFVLDGALAAAVGVGLQAMRAAKPAGLADGVWAAMIAVAAFKKLHSARSDEWLLLVVKANAWIEAQLAAGTSQSLQALADLQIVA